MASLVGKPDDTNGGTYSNSSGGYWPTGEWQLYKYYNQAQTGVRVASQRSLDNYFDTFATWNPLTSRGAIIAGTNAVNGTYNIKLQNLNKLAVFKWTKKARVIVKEVCFPGIRSMSFI